MKKPKGAARPLPEKPSLEHLKKQARALQKQVRAGNREAVARVRAHHPRLSDAAARDFERFSLSDAQLVIAREYGFASYAKLKAAVERAAGKSLARDRVNAAQPSVPVIALGAGPLFPGSRPVVDLQTAHSLAAAEAALAERCPVLCVLKRDPQAAAFERSGLHPIGTLAEVESVKRRPDGAARLLLRCGTRARVTELLAGETYYRAQFEALPPLTWSASEAPVLARRLYARLEPIARRTEWLSLAELVRKREANEIGALIETGVRQCSQATQQALLELEDPETFGEQLCLALDSLAGAKPRPLGSGHEQTERQSVSPEACLVVLHSEDHPHLVGRRFGLREKVTQLGRSIESDVALHSDAVSRFHARIVHDDDDFVLIDLESTNGTFVDGVEGPVQRHALADGVQICIGGVVLQFLRGGDLEAKCRAAADYVEAHDGLTGAHNRIHWFARLEREVLLARGAGRPLCALAIAVDEFGSLAQRLGQLAANGILRQVAQLLQRELEPTAILGRLDQRFGVTLPGSTLDETLELGERLRAAVAARRLDAGEAEVRVTLSVGAATLYWTTGGRELADDALAALEEAKLAGGNRVQAADAAAA
jgi:diguanylate cyclase (GGDEF)-like protein